MIRAKSILVLLLCCSLSPLPLPAQGAGAMLYATGQVTVNGHAAANSIAIFPGDHVVVGPNSSATISAQLFSAQVAGQSDVTWEQQAIAFRNGSLTVAAQAPWQVHIGEMTVSLGPEMSKVEVIQREDVALVKLEQGSANLNEAGQTTALKVGFTVARPHVMVASTPASSVPAAAGAHSSHIGIIAVAAGGAAAAGIGLGLRGHGTQTPVSPSVP
ncbi:MAG: hypothetical protein ACRD3E_16060 [Terriglobales bacterium]